MIVRHHAIVFLSVMIGVAITAISEAAMTQSPSISGRVVDAAGWPVPGAFVTVTDDRGGSPPRVTTGRDGTYQFAALADGTYRIDFELLGFDRMRRNHVRVRAGATATGDVTMYVSSICECVNIQSRTTLSERPGIVTDESGRPLEWVRLQMVSPTHSGVAYTDSEGRFRVRAPVNESWPLTASESGFVTATQQVTGGVEEPVIFKLRRSGTPVPDIERFSGPCCPTDLFTYEGR
jgi:hypothetical protein